MEYITVKQMAKLKGCSVRYIKRIAHDGKLETVQEMNPQNHCMQYKIPVSALPEELRTRYYSFNMEIVPDSAEQPPDTPKKDKRQREKRDMGSFSAEEREVIAFWSDTIREWRIKRREYESLDEGDTVFIAHLKAEKKNFLREHGITVSRQILYRKYRYFKDGDLMGLCEARGGHNRGKNSLSPQLEKVFYDLYLCDRELPISDCCRLTAEWARENCPELAAAMPSERTFRRAAERLPQAVVKYFRYSEKECRDECLPYIIRLYDDIEANDVWVADNHTLDFMTRTNDGSKVHRLYITGILDAKTQVLVGWNITENPSSESTVLALRHAIMRCGVPKMLYVDNGREFLTHDIGGKGHRRRKSQENVTDPPTILEHLGVKMINAIPENGRAKPIERMFLTLKNTISRVVATFTGGNIMERPESLRWQLKHGFVPYDSQIREQLDILLEGYNGSLYSGCEPQFAGLTRAEAWCRSIRRRTFLACDEGTLNLLLMRTTRYQKVRENGVFVTYGGEKLWYNCGADNWKYVGKEVYVRYDPAELDTVRIYDRDDRYMGDWYLDMSVFVDYITAEGGDIADRQRLIAHQIRAIRQMGSELTGDMRIDALALAVSEANRKVGAVSLQKPDNIEMITAEERQLPKAAGEHEELDYKRLIQGAENRLKNENN